MGATCYRLFEEGPYVPRPLNIPTVEEGQAIMEAVQALPRREGWTIHPPVADGWLMEEYGVEGIRVYRVPCSSPNQWHHAEEEIVLCYQESICCFAAQDHRFFDDLVDQTIRQANAAARRAMQQALAS